MPRMRRFDSQQATRWLARRERHAWSWLELSARSGHPVWRLRYWQRRLAETAAGKPDRSRGFVTVDITEPEPVSASSTTAIEITTPSGYRVRVAHDFDPEHLRRVVQALERGC